MDGKHTVNHSVSTVPRKFSTGWGGKRGVDESKKKKKKEKERKKKDKWKKQKRKGTHWAAGLNLR